MKKAIIIPTYLPIKNDTDVSKLEGIQLLQRAIKSLDILEDRNFVLVLPFCLDIKEGDFWTVLSRTDEKVRQAMKDCVGSIPMVVFTRKNLVDFSHYIEEGRFKNLFPHLDLCDYPKIRNSGLIVAQLLGVDALLFMDNDEVIRDPKFLSTAEEFLDRDHNGIRVSGKAGFYIEPDGSILLKGENPWWRLSWNKISLMNRVFQSIIDSESRLVRSPIILGGNLLVHRTLFEKVPFDPFIPRGEDIDYQINAEIFGFHIFFDKDQVIHHLHPQRAGTFFLGELKGDIKRFLYERAKVRRYPEINLDPYPGYFLRGDFRLKAILTLLLFALDHLIHLDFKGLAFVLRELGSVFHDPEDVPGRYLRFQEEWEIFMKELSTTGLKNTVKEWGYNLNITT
jgi:GT2 family glycosyltransferase